jgi:peptidyl-prolyl cis-trans isomerase-like 4
MSVLVETTLGALVVDLHVDACPLASKNFIKLCKAKYYHGNLFFNVQENFMVQAGDPTATGKGGTSVYGLLYGEQARFFEDELRPQLTHCKKGVVGMASAGPNLNASQFYITTRGDDLEYLDGKHTIFGEIAEGLDVLDKINELFVDKDYRPYQDVRIKHTYVLEDPFPDPEGLHVPDESPSRERPEEEQVEARLAADEKLDEDDGRTEQEIEQSLREKEAKSRAVVLEMIGDIPDADVKPPEEVLFVCKLNPVTESSDLDMAFCRFGQCKAEVIRDFKTGDSLCFAFVEFQDKRHCEEAYFKMNNVLLDDRRIKVDFSQSVSKLWNKFSRRPWEKHSKSDGDPYANEKNRGGKGGSSRLFGNRDVGGNLRLKESHGFGSRGGGGNFDLVDEDDGKRRQSKHADAESRPRQRRSRSPDQKKRSRREDDDRSDRHRRSRSRSHSRRRDNKRCSPSVERRRRDRSSGRDSKRHDRDSRDKDRSDRKRSRSRSRSPTRHRSRRP